MYLQNKPELGVELHFPVPDLDVFSLLDGEPAQKSIQHCFHALANILQ